ncbi:DUF5301 domain-containing protein [Faecalimonas sp.]
MNKKKRTEIISFFIVLLACVLLYIFFMQRNRYTLTFPKGDDLENISLEMGSVTKEIIDEKTMKEFVLELSGDGRMTKQESVNDSPGVKRYTKVELNFKEKGSSVVYFYEEKGKYYLEQPYNGVYEISQDEYKGLEKYLNE